METALVIIAAVVCLVIAIVGIGTSIVGAGSRKQKELMDKHERNPEP